MVQEDKGSRKEAEMSVQMLAQLALIPLSEEEAITLAEELRRISTYAQELQQLPLPPEDGGSSAFVQSVMREDTPREIERDAAARLRAAASSHTATHFMVERVLEQ